MKTVLMPVLLLSLLVPERDGGALNDLVQLQGAWQVVSLQDRGEKVAEAVTRNMEVFISKERVTLRSAGETSGEFVLQLDPTRKPRAVDLTSTRGDDKGKRYPGIYLLDKNLLKVVLTEAGQPRPTGFGPEETQRLTVFVLRKR